MILLECCCGRPIPPEPVGCVFNHPVVMSCLIWAVVVLVFGVLLFVYMIIKDKLKCKESKDAREQELNLKEKAFEKEKYWHFQNALQHDFKKELNDKIGELEEKLQAEKNSREDKLKQERLQMEHDYYKKILDDFYNKDNK